MNKIIGLVYGVEDRKTKFGGFFQIILKTELQLIKCVFWTNDHQNSDILPKKGEFVEVFDFKDQLDTQYLNVIVNKNGFKIIEKATLSQDLIEKIYNVKKASTEDLKKAYNLITDSSIYKNQDVYKFVMACYASVDKETLLKCPAATSVHHNYSGGLLIHTGEVLQIAKSMTNGFPNLKLINSDLIHGGASLHDLGKTNTYKINEIGQISSSVEEKTLGHIYFSLKIMESVQKTHPISNELFNELMHIVAFYHGSPEFGAIKTPATLEAIIVSQADFLGSRLGIIDTKIQTLKEQKHQLEDDWKQYGDYYAVTSSIRSVFNSRP